MTTHPSITAEERLTNALRLHALAVKARQDAVAELAAAELHVREAREREDHAVAELRAASEGAGT